jgi:hypothetical protein
MAKSFECGDWSAEEDQRLLLLHESFGNRWSMISSKMVNRSENCVKNRFNAIVKTRDETAHTHALSEVHQEEALDQPTDGSGAFEMMLLCDRGAFALRSTWRHM